MQLGSLNSKKFKFSTWPPIVFLGEPVKLSKPVILGALFLILAILAAYWPVYSAGFVWDDDAYVTQNTLLTETDGWWNIWFSAHFQSQYFPLVYSTLRLEYGLWGLDPLGYHVVNVCLHIVNSLLVWILLKRLTVPGAWLVAAIFALHPVQVETVAWVTELKNTESTMFYLLTVLTWLKFCGDRSGWSYMLALAFCLLALFAKTTACTLPAVLLLVLWLKNKPLNGQRIFQVLPFLIMGIGMGLLSVWWERHLGNIQPRYHLLGGPVDRLLVATHALWFYAGKVFWPSNLTFSYPRWAINAGDWRQYIWLVGCVSVAVALWLGRRKLGRGPATAFLFFASALSPMLGFLALYTFYFSYVADHYQYLACLGMVALAVGAAIQLFEKRAVPKPLQIVLAFIVLFVLSVLTWNQCRVYKNLETLFGDTLVKNPRSWMAHTNLGRLLVKQGKFSEAEVHYQAALAINPGEEDLHYNYGNLLVKMNRLDAAATQYDESLQIAPQKPDTHNNLGFVFYKQQRIDEAITEYKLAISCKPDFADAYYNLGNAYWKEHKMDQAVAAYQQAVRLEPDSEIFKNRLRVLGLPGN